jgi:hypothetical protein
MPAVIDTPEVVEHEEHNLHEEQPQGRGARSGFWYRLGQYVRGHRVHTSSRTQSSARSVRHQRESSMACEAPEPRTLLLLGFWGLHNS